MWATILVYAILLVIGGGLYLLARRTSRGASGFLRNLGLGHGLQQGGGAAVDQPDRQNGPLARTFRQQAVSVAGTSAAGQSDEDDMWTQVETTLDGIYQEFYGQLAQLQKTMERRLADMEWDHTEELRGLRAEIAALQRERSAPTKGARAASAGRSSAEPSRRADPPVETSTASPDAEASQSDAVLDERLIQAAAAIRSGESNEIVAKRLGVGLTEVALMRRLVVQAAKPE